MPLTPCIPYEWYLVIRCKKCGARQPIHHDKSQGKSSLLRSYESRCVQCQHVDTYKPEEIERYQHVVHR